ncbi:MAG: alpha/beta hydrolase [Alphaproteobacteria bacterium]
MTSSCWQVTEDGSGPNQFGTTEPDAVHDAVMSDGAVIRLRRHGNPEGPRLALSHGNGLAIQGYVDFWRLLLPDYDLILFDMRNHGENPLHDAENHHWERFAEDMEEIRDAMDRAFGQKPVTGVFHSLSAVTSVMHADRYPGRWSGLVLFDPPIYPRDGHPLQPVEYSHMREMDQRARRRPPYYDRPGLLAAQFRRRPEFARWVPGAADRLAEATLRKDDIRDRWELCCPRELEAHVYLSNTDVSVWNALCRPLPIPVSVIAADPTLEGQPPPAKICRALAEEATAIAYCSIPDTTHFLQIEQPEMCVAALKDALEGRLGNQVADSAGNSI